MNDSELELYGIVGRMFREIREEKKLSLTAVSEYLQIAPISLQRYECGERKIKMGTIKKLCVFYKIEYDDFIREAKLRFGKNIYNDDSFKQEKSPKIMQYYEQLNDIGKHEATKRVEELTNLPQYVVKIPTVKNDTEVSNEFFTEPNEARKYLEKHKVAAFNGGKNLSDEAIIQMANIALNKSDKHTEGEWKKS